MGEMWARNENKAFLLEHPVVRAYLEISAYFVLIHARMFVTLHYFTFVYHFSSSLLLLLLLHFCFCFSRTNMLKVFFVDSYLMFLFSFSFFFCQFYIVTVYSFVCFLSSFLLLLLCVFIYTVVVPSSESFIRYKLLNVLNRISFTVSI